MSKKKTRTRAVQTRHPRWKKAREMNRTGDGWWLAVALPFAVFAALLSNADITYREIGARVGLRWISKDNNTSWVVGLYERAVVESNWIFRRIDVRFVLFHYRDSGFTLCEICCSLGTLFVLLSSTTREVNCFGNPAINQSDLWNSPSADAFVYVCGGSPGGIFSCIFF